MQIRRKRKEHVSRVSPLLISFVIDWDKRNHLNMMMGSNT